MTGVGSYTGSASPYGTFDQGGNVQEWNEQAVGGSSRVVRGGGGSSGPSALAASSWSSTNASNQDQYLGFRVAGPVPEPGSGLLAIVAMGAIRLLHRCVARVR